MLKVVKKVIDIGLYPISLYMRQIAGTIVLLFLARYLSVYDYGLFSSYKTLATFMLIFTCLGYQEYILISSDKNVRDVQLKIGLFLINAILIILFIILGSIFSNIELKHIFILVLIRQFLDCYFFSITLPYFQVTNKFNIISYINIFYAFITIMITFFCYVFKLSLCNFLIISIIVGIFNVIQVLFYSKINYIMLIKNIKKLFMRIDKTIFSYMIVNILGYLYTQIPALYISLFIFKEKASLYFAAYTIANIIFLLLGAQSQKIIPEMMCSDINKVKKIIKNNIIFLSSINLIIFILFIFAGKFLLKLIYSNPYYIQAYPILLILTFANFIFAIMVVFGTYLTASKNQNLKIKVQFHAVLLSILFLFLFNQYEIYGAAYTYLITGIYLMFGYMKKSINLINKKEVKQC